MKIAGLVLVVLGFTALLAGAGPTSDPGAGMPPAVLPACRPNDGPHVTLP